MWEKYLISRLLLFVLFLAFWVLIIQDIGYAYSKGKIYFSEPNKIYRANLNGTDVEEILTGIGWVTDLALDMKNRKIYWVSPPRIYRANLDGSNIEKIIEGEVQNNPPGKLSNDPFSIALDIEANKVYWGNNGPWDIRSVNNDGSNIEHIVIEDIILNNVLLRISIDAESLELDVKEGKMYFVDSHQDNIARANLDGSDYEHLGIFLVDPRGLTLDLQNREMYWTQQARGIIRRASFDGDNKETLLTDLTIPYDIALDIHSREMYWTEGDNRKGIVSRIRRANFDGSKVTEIYNGLNSIFAIALDVDRFYDVVPTTDRLTNIWASMKVK
ncbi:hypothetical protein JT359_02155 [Candidatus Poribacteria bacterium]|nr:hypothetical protein [Candidatus Poribacteria bacterium]